MTLPTVRYFLLCDEIVVDPGDPRRVSIMGLLSAIRPSKDPKYPYLKAQLSVFLQLVECRGDADGQIRFVHADSEEVVFESQVRRLTFRHDPLEVYGVRFRFRDCLFPEPGLYSVQFWYNDESLAQQPLLLK